MLKFAATLFMLAIAWGCTKSPDGNVTLTFVNKSGESDSIFVARISQDTTLAKTVVPANGEVVVQFTIPRRLALMLKVGDAEMTLFTDTGDEMTIEIQRDTQRNVIFFSGDNAVINNYLTLAQPLYEQSRHYVNYDPRAFRAKYDSIHQAFDSFVEAYARDHDVDQPTRAVLNSFNLAELLLMGEVEVYVFHNDLLVQKLTTYLKRGEVSDLSLPVELAPFTANIPRDTLMANLEVPTYRNYMSIYTLHLSAEDFKLQDWEKLQYYRALIVHKKIAAKRLPPVIQEFMQAQNILVCMMDYGLTPEIDSLFEAFKAQYKSPHTRRIQELHDKQYALRTGEIAPSFSGTGPDGAAVSLEDFKGKVVYLDVWATWCGPCVEEVPHSVKLQKALSRSGIAFLNISIDRDKTKWLDYLHRHPEWAGTHILFSREENADFEEKYQRVGVPRYVIIDEAGKIVKANAPRPSNSATRGLLESLLKQ